MFRSYKINQGYPEINETVDGYIYTLSCLPRSSETAEVVFMVCQLTDKDKYQERIYPEMDKVKERLTQEVIRKEFKELKAELINKLGGY